MKDGVFLSDFSSEHFYKIQSVSRSDAGDYRCFAKNSVGTIISEKIKLTVACKLISKNLLNTTLNLELNFVIWQKKVSSNHCVKIPEATVIMPKNRIGTIISEKIKLTVACKWTPIL